MSQAGIHYNQRNLSMDFLRIVACLMVITLHVTAEGVYANPTPILIIYHCITAGAAPLFFMLSGAFTRGDDIRKYILKALSMVALFIIFQFLFTISDCFFQYKTISLPLLQELGITSFRISKYHLWYLPAYASVLLIAPIINAASERNPSIIKYLCGLFFVYTMIPELFSLAGIDWDISRKLNELIPIQPLGYIGYYCLGRILYDHFSSRSARKQMIRLAALILWCTSVAATSLVTLINSKSAGNFDPAKIDRFSPLILLSDSLLFIVFATGSLNDSGLLEALYRINCNKFVSLIVSCSLWIYLIHPFFMDFLSDFGFNCLSFNSIVSVPLKVISVFLLSLIFGLICNVTIRLLRNLYSKRLFP